MALFFLKKLDIKKIKLGKILVKDMLGCILKMAFKNVLKLELSHDMSTT